MPQTATMDAMSRVCSRSLLVAPSVLSRSCHNSKHAVDVRYDMSANSPVCVTRDPAYGPAACCEKTECGYRISVIDVRLGASLPKNECIGC